MRRRSSFLLLGIGLVAAMAGSCNSRRASDDVVEQLRIGVTVHADGSVDVSESFTVRSFARPPKSFERRLHRTRVDRIVDVRASATQGSVDAAGDSRVEFDRWGNVRIVWPAGAGEQGKTFNVQYRATGALSVEGTRAWLDRQILPLDPAYPVADAAVSLRFPAEMPVVNGPALSGGYWETQPIPPGARFTRSGIEQDEDVVLTAEFDVGAVTMLMPAWQENADRAREMAPAFVTGAFFILVIGAGAVIMVRVQYPKRQAAAGVKTALRDVAKGLVITGLVVLALGGAVAAGVPFVVERYGRAIVSIPGSILVVGVLMVLDGVRLGRERSQSR